MTGGGKWVEAAIAIWVADDNERRPTRPELRAPAAYFRHPRRNGRAEHMWTPAAQRGLLI